MLLSQIQNKLHLVETLHTCVNCHCRRPSLTELEGLCACRASASGIASTTWSRLLRGVFKPCETPYSNTTTFPLTLFETQYHSLSFCLTLSPPPTPQSPPISPCSHSLLLTHRCINDHFFLSLPLSPYSNSLCFHHHHHHIPHHSQCLPLLHFILAYVASIIVALFSVTIHDSFCH